MVLNYFLGALAVLSQLLLFWQWLAARRFPLHRRSSGRESAPSGESAPVRSEPAHVGCYGGEADSPNRDSALQPGVTLLKPLKGADEHTEMCLRSWLTQDYAGSVQTLFGVAAADDPAVAVVRKLLAEFPKADAQLVVCPEPLGANAKVAKLIQLERLAKHELICVSDADVRVPADFLAEAVMPLASGAPASGTARSEAAVPEAGAPANAALVNCFFRLANPTTLAMQCEAVAINADFWSQVLQSCSLKPMDFALGAATLTRRTELAGIGGFEAIRDCLADDYQLGNRIVRGGSGMGVSPVSSEPGSQAHGRDARATRKRIVLCPVVVECWDAPMGWAAMWQHQLRWARTIRVCQPVPYFFSILSNATLWPLLWTTAQLNRPVFLFLGAALVARMLVTADLQRRLAGDEFKIQNSKFKIECPPVHVGGYGRYCWLAPVKDLMQVAIWALAFVGNTIEWRGRRMKVRRDGTLIPA